MKKLLGIFLSLILFLGLASVSLAEGEGHYLLDSFSDGEMTMDREAILEAGLEWYILLEEDGVAQIQFDELVQGIWVDGIISVTVDGETEELPYTIDGDALILDLYGESATFMRSDDAPQEADPDSSQKD